MYTLDKIRFIEACNKFSVVVIVIFVLATVCEPAADDYQMTEFEEIEGLFEPSGIVQLNDGRLLVVEDEPVNPFVLLTPNSENSHFRISKLKINTFFQPALRHVDDLEGVAKDPNGYVYAITSHSRKSNGKRDSEREKLMRFSIDGDRLKTSSVRKDFRNTLIETFPALREAARERDVKDESGLNIEGLALAPDASVSWVGLRAPLFDKKAILVGVRNLQSAFESGESFQFVETLEALDLDGGGIRDIAYDHTLSGYLILSQRENTKRNSAFKLWLWSGDANAAPRRVRITGIDKLNRTEGIASIRLNGENLLMLVNDDGSRDKNTPASYLLTDYTRLDIEATN